MKTYQGTLKPFNKTNIVNPEDYRFKNKCFQVVGIYGTNLVVFANAMDECFDICADNGKLNAYKCDDEYVEEFINEGMDDCLTVLGNCGDYYEFRCDIDCQEMDKKFTKYENNS